MVHSPEGDTNFLDIVAGVLQIDTLAPYIFIIKLDHVIWISVDQIEIVSYLNGKKQKIDHKNMTGATNVDDFALVGNTPV